MPFHFDYEETFPATDFNQINLDWILQLATQLKETAESGGFDGAPGEPGTATNGIAFITASDTFADIQTAITNGELPVLMFYNLGTPIFMYCFDYSNSGVKFGGLSNTKQLQLTWYANETKNLTTRTLVSNQSPQFYGNPTVPTQEPTNSSTRIANTQFVQLAVQTAVQNAIEQLVIAPFSENFKQALLQLARKVAYIDSNGDTYYQALYDALYPPINVDYITAVWSPPVGYVVYSTDSLDSLKNELIVTAYYDDQTSAILDNSEYALSGTLIAGTSPITITYAGASVVVNIPVVENALDYISATFDQGTEVIYTGDSLIDLVPYLTVTATYTNLNTVYVEYPDYSLSGSLTAGTSTITVTYAEQTTTFNVTVIWGYELTESDFTRKKGIKHTYPYYGTNNDSKRISYVPFDLLLTGGSPYVFTATSTYNTAEMGLQFFNETALTKVANHQDFEAEDIYDPGWQSLIVTVTPPATVNNSPVAGVRVTFRQSSSNPVISDAFKITKLTIGEGS